MDKVVIKCGGSTLDQLPDTFYSDIVSLQNSGLAPVIVHGGGPAISAVLHQMGIEAKFIDGLRVTDEQTLQVAQMVLIGQTNKQLVRRIQQAGGRSAGISGIDSSTLLVAQGPEHLGFVGIVEKVDPYLIEALCAAGCIPVIAPIGVDQGGQFYNVNADTAAGAVAGALGAARLLMVTDVPGVLRERNGVRELIAELNESEIKQLIQDGVIYGGMIPKVTAALDALGQQVEEVVIVSGYEPGILIEAANGAKEGTKIIKQGKAVLG
ncbi:acetylglutamate kinase [Aneurinibacillus sp. Ricciae_BoGa-3]|uniref:acetylglutamate kinase n=1 Tax=Aneurinibacillus sp. Ricciae_BoGa-3 TaxID=3022697 RepID=UPI0023419EA8|nr:acetylglutamate kinase [Aneurinibacillus sp. Ricciae_BoGa-3]WCK54164.1 acetylglutamate kinase [Aneurinibacillus sp. Ricciae_BoGa-3]